MSCDYTFFRNVVGPFIDGNKLLDLQSTVEENDLNNYNERKITEFLEEIAPQTLSLGSASQFEVAHEQLDKKIKSFLSPEMEKMIPQAPETMVQNKKLIAIWLE